MKTIQETLFGYPDNPVLDGEQGILGETLEHYGGVLPLMQRWTARTFCRHKPGHREGISTLRISLEDIRPPALGADFDETWICMTRPIVTGVIDSTTDKAPFREGESHVVLRDHVHVVHLQQL